MTTIRYYSDVGIIHNRLSRLFATTRRARESRDAIFGGGVRVRRRRCRRDARGSRFVGRPSRRVERLRLRRRADGRQPVRIARTVGGGKPTVVGAEYRDRPGRTTAERRKRGCGGGDISAAADAREKRQIVRLHRRNDAPSHRKVQTRLRSPDVHRAHIGQRRTHRSTEPPSLTMIDICCVFFSPLVKFLSFLHTRVHTFNKKYNTHYSLVVL